jgi:eukaryotic-like serine/threonine-protein kinase
VVEPSRTSLGNRYELRGLLATGGMGQVWRAHDVLLGRPVAVKVLRSEFTGDPLFRARFRAEAQLAAALSHPNIAAVYDYGEEATTDGSGECLAYLVMELVEGESLSDLLARTGPLSPDQTLEVLRQTAAALAVAHAAGVVHRDVKPGNVLVSEGGTVKITDFGIAWSAGSVPLTQTGQVLGTAAYLSPEQAAGSHATAASDVYALGMVGYECLTGRKAFEGDNSVAVALRQLRDQPEPLPADIPAGVRDLIGHALVKDPAHRWPDGSAFVAAVDDVRADRALPPVDHSDTRSFWLVPGESVDTAVRSGSTSSGPIAGSTSVEPGTGAGPARPVVTPPVARGRQRAFRVLVPLVSLLVGAGAAVAVVEQLTPAAAEAPVAAAQVGGPAAPVAAAGLLIGATDFLDRPVDEVVAELTAHGLQVDTQQVTTPDVEPGLVVAVSPTGTPLEPGDVVLVRYAIAPGGADPTTSSRSRAAVDAVVRSPAATTAAAPTTTSGPTTAADTSTAADGSSSAATTTGSQGTSDPAAGSSTSGASSSGRTSPSPSSSATRTTSSSPARTSSSAPRSEPTSGSASHGPGTEFDG